MSKNLNKTNNPPIWVICFIGFRALVMTLACYGALEIVGVIIIIIIIIWKNFQSLIISSQLIHGYVVLISLHSIQI